MYLLGFDIGGTKCAVITARWDGRQVSLLQKQQCPTERIPPEEMISKLIALAEPLLTEKPAAIGISCGGPLDSARGIILGPPNLPGWDHVDIVKQLETHYGVPVKLQNDANACAVAEWKFGAGRGCEHMVFLTFGTGMGAGLILNNQLYTGANDNAGEAGHVRLDSFGPTGYGKLGSFEGFCSGGGIAQLGYWKALECAQQGRYPAYFKAGMALADVSTRSIAQAAQAGDPTALEVYRLCGHQLGRALSMLIDILNPQRIVIGSIFGRCEPLLRKAMEEAIAAEALPAAAQVCQIVPAGLGEKIGDYAAIATAIL